MRRVILAAGLAAFLGLAPAASAQQILSQSRSVEAYSETYEPFFDNITYTDKDTDSTTAAGAFNAVVEASTNFLNFDYGYGTATQYSTIDTKARTFNASGYAAAESLYGYGADSLANGKSRFEMTFQLKRKGKLTLLGTMQGSGYTYYPGDESLVTNVYAMLKVTNVGTGAVVYQKRTGLGESVDLEDGELNLSRGTYRVEIVAFCENSTYPAEYLAAYETFSQFDITGSIVQY